MSRSSTEVAASAQNRRRINASRDRLRRRIGPRERTLHFLGGGGVFCNPEKVPIALKRGSIMLSVSIRTGLEDVTIRGGEGAGGGGG